MGKYSIGELVVVRDDLSLHKQYLTEDGDDGIYPRRAMMQWAGKMVTISGEKDGFYRSLEGGEIWTAGMFDEEATYLAKFMKNRTILSAVDFEKIEDEIFVNIQLDNGEILMTYAGTCHQVGYQNDKEFLETLNILFERSMAMKECHLHIQNNRRCLHVDMNGINFDLLLAPKKQKGERHAL